MDKKELLEEIRRALEQHKEMYAGDDVYDTDTVEGNTASLLARASKILWEGENYMCYECGQSVKMGSGKFVNRIPSLDSYEERVEMNVEFPEGAYLCEECDQDAQNGVEK